MRVALVAAVARNHLIGANGALAWRISDDLKWFKKVTLGKPVVMGRKTYQSIGRPLPSRDNIVITRVEDFCVDGLMTAHSIDAAIELARDCAERSGVDEICIIGGGEIYAQTLAVADRIYLTRVAVELEGDVLFPDIDSVRWDEERQFSCKKTIVTSMLANFSFLTAAANKPEKP